MLLTDGLAAEGEAAGLGERQARARGVGPQPQLLPPARPSRAPRASSGGRRAQDPRRRPALSPPWTGRDGQAEGRGRAEGAEGFRRGAAGRSAQRLGGAGSRAVFLPLLEARAV